MYEVKGEEQSKTVGELLYCRSLHSGHVTAVCLTEVQELIV